MKRILLALTVLMVFMLVGCTPSQRVAYNLNIEAEQFKIPRRIAAINGFTDKPLFEMVGYCSIESGESYVGGMLEITCKIGEDSFTKDFIYLSDNVLIVIDQVDGVDVPQYHYQMIFTPQALLPIPEIIIDEGGN